MERAVGYVKSSFLKDFQAFSSLEDIQEKFELWAEQLADSRRMHTADGLPFTPQERFTLEKTALLPITKAPLNNYRLEKRKVGVGGLVNVDYCRYQLPTELMEQSVDLMIGDNKSLSFTREARLRVWTRIPTPSTVWHKSSNLAQTIWLVHLLPSTPRWQTR